MAGGGAHDGTTEANAWTLAEAIAGYASGHRINIIAGTYANTTTSRTFATAGTTTAPVWWRGYKTATAAGDLDTRPTSARTSGTDAPLISFTTGAATISGAHQRFSNIHFTGANSGAMMSVTGAFLDFVRCRFENTSSNAAAVAWLNNTYTGSVTANECWFKAPATATRVVNLARRLVATGCVFEGGISCVGNSASASAALQALLCEFRSPASYAINSEAARTWTSMDLMHCTFSRCGGSAIRLDAVPTAQIYSIINCLFSRSGGYDIENASGANTNFVTRLNNASYSATSGHESGFGDASSWFPVTESSDPLASASDLTLSASANSVGGASPQNLEGYGYASKPDVGANQRAPSVGGLANPIISASGGLIMRGM